MIGFCVLAPLGDGIAKLLSDSVPLWQLLLTRFGMQFLLLIPVILWTGGDFRMGPRLLRLTILRSILHIIGIGAMFTALGFLPLADALAIAFVMPFITLLLGKYVLSEEVGTRRLAACCAGFTGTLLVIQPSFAAVGLPALLPLVVAVTFALFMLVTRQIAKEADPVSLQASSGVIASAILLLIFVIAPDDTSGVVDIIIPDSAGIMLLVLLGIIGTLAHLLMTWSLRFAPSATVAPIQYLEIPFATLIGWLIFKDLPNNLASLGIIITMAAGLYILYRERVTSGTQDT